MDNEKKNFARVILRVALVLISAILIVSFFPREGDFSYDFSVGKPWRYGQIIADYDFPIYKSENTIKAELDSVLKTFQPYYTLDSNVVKVQISTFQRNFHSNELQSIPPAYLKYVEEKLKEIYAAGIVDSHDYAMMQDSGYKAIRIEQSTTADVRPLKRVFTTRSAYSYILMMADSIHINRDVLERCNLNNYLFANLNYDKTKSHGQRVDLQMSVSYASGMVQAGQKIVDRGEIITPHMASIIESMKKEYIKRHENNNVVWLQMVGEFLIVILILILFMIYLGMFRKKYLKNTRSLCLLFLLVVGFSICTSLVGQHHLQSVYIVPIATVAIFISVFMDTRTAFVTHFITVFIASMSLHDPYVFSLVQFLAGVVAIYSLRELTSRSQIIRTAFIVTAVTLFFMFGYELSMGHTPKMMDTSWFMYEGLNGVLLLFTYPFIFVFERLFGFTSSVTLIELSNVSNPLLRELSKQAPGTFNHSMQVANLASEVAAKIDADVLLVRTGALYHDIGKLENAAYFTENQTGTNPHDSLSEERSAQIIIQHVKDGLALAEKYHLPKVLKDFIATHHGTSKASYFYIKYLNNHPNEPVDITQFTYPGPNPFTREQAILMMADSVEAASKSLTIVDEDSLRKLVDNIIDTKVQEGYFINCPITFRDIATTKEVFMASLKMIFHMRISYPTLDEQNRKTDNKSVGNSLFGYRHNFYRGKYNKDR